MSRFHVHHRGRARLLAAVAAGALLTAGLAACGESESDSGSAGSAGSGGEKVRIGVIGFANSNNFTQWAFYGAKKEAKEVGAEVTLIDGKFDPKAQSAAMQNAMQSDRFDALLLFPVDSQTMIPIVKQAGDKGLPVAVGDVLGTPEQTQKLQTVNPGVISTIAAPSGPQQEAFVTLIKQACAAKTGEGAPCKVALMPGVRTFPIDAIKIKHVEAELKKTSNITYALTPDTNFDKPGGYKAGTTFLQNNKDIDVVFASGDDPAFGMMQALQENGLKPGEDVSIIGFGGTKEGVKAVRDGLWFGTVALYPSVIGQQATKILAAAVRKEPYEKLVDPALLPGAHLIVTKKVLDEDPDYTGDYSPLAPPDN